MNIYKKWLPVLKTVPESNHLAFAEELEKEYQKALIFDPSTESIMTFVNETVPILKEKYSKEIYISPFTGDTL
jgi:hypothetical protein